MAIAYNEYKYLVTKENLQYVRSLLEGFYGGSDPFPEGIVDSIYYDDILKSSFLQCREGEPRKKKVRIRGYGNDTFNQIHIKEKDLFGVKKQKVKIDPVKCTHDFIPSLEELAPLKPDAKRDSCFFALIFQNGYQIPIVRVRYYRYRYRINDYRITLDTNIEIMGGYNLNNIAHNYDLLPHHVLEIKTLDERPVLPLLGLIKLPQISFSKFFLGINIIESDSSLLFC